MSKKRIFITIYEDGLYDQAKKIAKKTNPSFNMWVNYLIKEAVKQSKQ
jgi:predicted HicB family RNase H-like nuclease